VKVKNETDYRTDDLRKILRRCIVECGMNPKRYRIRIYKSRTHRVTGRAPLHGRSLRIGIPCIANWYSPEAEAHETRELDVGAVERIARTAIHEIGHNQGLMHRDWASKYRVREKYKDEPLKLSREERSAALKQKRADHARGMADKYEREIRRKQKFLKKWRSKIRYYEKRKAAAR